MAKFKVHNFATWFMDNESRCCDMLDHKFSPCADARLLYSYTHVLDLDGVDRLSSLVRGYEVLPSNAPTSPKKGLTDGTKDQSKSA